MSYQIKPAAFDAVMAEIRERSKKRVYQQDFAAWLWDVLGEKNYEKMAEISHDVFFGEKNKTLIKSGNGVGKTRAAGIWAMYWVSAFPPEESLAILTAPTLTQVKLGAFAYIKDRYGYAKAQAAIDQRPNPMPGWLSEQGEWKYRTPGGNSFLAVSRVPTAGNAVSTMQGLRKTGGRNFIVLDEAGGVSRDIFTAIDALMTSGDSRMAGIGNPDNRGTEFHAAFTEKVKRLSYNLHTISGYDLPGYTGERVYPRTAYGDEKEALLLRGLTGKEWIADKERQWMTGGQLVPDEDDPKLIRRIGGKPEGRFSAKVLGEFPGDADNALFSEEDINAALESDFTAPSLAPDPYDILTPEQLADPDFDVEAALAEHELSNPRHQEWLYAPSVMGVDVASTGDDESVVMVNRGGRVRLFEDTVEYVDFAGVQQSTTGLWSKANEVESAWRIHAIATHLGVTQVRIDGVGLGGGVASMLEKLFPTKTYVVIRIIGSQKSLDDRRWSNFRSQNHDALREKMRDREIDLDPNDTVLKDQLLAVTYKSNEKGALAVTPKKEMRSDMHGSPDRMDAVIYSIVDVSPAIEEPESNSVQSFDPWEILGIGNPLMGGYPV